MATLILAHDSNFGIGKSGRVPWDIPLDRHFFYDMTTKTYEKGKPNLLVMGRVTFLSFPTLALSNRLLIVVSKTLLKEEKTKNKEVYIVANLRAALEVSQTLSYGKMFICGGKEIYRESLDLDQCIDTVFVTQIDKDYVCDVHVDFLSRYLEPYYKIEEKGFRLPTGIKVSFTKYEKAKKEMNTKESEKEYLSLIYDIIKENHRCSGRNGVTLSLFARTLSFDLKEGFPLLTTKSVFFRGVVEELIFFLNGFTDTKLLEEKGIRIWKENTSTTFLQARNLPYREGEMGPMYGFNWIHYGSPYRDETSKGTDGKDAKGINQIEHCLELLRSNPHSRHILMTSFNPLEVSKGVLYPCHGIHIQFYVDHQNRLSCLMTQRSADVCCGLPFNVASYAFLIHLFCNVLQKYTPGRLTIVCGDTHIYEEHIENAMRQCLREPYSFPTLLIKKQLTRLNEITFQDIQLLDYEHHPPLKYVLKS